MPGLLPPRHIPTLPILVVVPKRPSDVAPEPMPVMAKDLGLPVP